MTEVANPFHPHKLLLHPEKVATLANGEIPAPQTIEVDLTDGACNQGCVFCCFSSGEGEKMVKIDPAALHQALSQAYTLGTRAIELVGGGEPTAHPKIAEIIRDTLAIGDGDMEVGLITNGLLADRVLPVAERMRFLRISLDTANADTYQTLHRVPPRQFDKVLKNIERLRATLPKVANSRQLGIGYLVVPPHNHTATEILTAARLAHELNVDYIVYRPVSSEHPQAHWWEAQQAIAAAKKYLSRINSHTAAFGGVGTRWDVLKPGGHPTGICDAKPLVAIIQANGDIAHCNLYRNARDMRLGNIHEGSFTDQWFSEHHRVAWQTRQIDGCPNPCKFYQYNDVVRAFAAGTAQAVPSRDEVAHHLFL